MKKRGLVDYSIMLSSIIIAIFCLFSIIQGHYLHCGPLYGGLWYSPYNSYYNFYGGIYRPYGNYYGFYRGLPSFYYEPYNIMYGLYGSFYRLYDNFNNVPYSGIINPYGHLLGTLRSAAQVITSLETALLSNSTLSSILSADPILLEILASDLTLYNAVISVPDWLLYHAPLAATYPIDLIIFASDCSACHPASYLSLVGLKTLI